MINILLDENLTFELIRLFEKFEFNVFHVKKLGKTGIKNGEVYQLAKELKAWIITRDRDFSNIVKFQLYQPEGIIFIKVKTPVHLR